VKSFEYSGDYYKAIGDFLREEYHSYSFTRGTQSEVEFLIRRLELAPPSRLLDVGCGTGRHSLELARHGFKPVGIDISPGFIEVAQQKAQAENLPAEFRVADARHLEAEKLENFDAAICLCEGAFGIAGDDAAHSAILTGIQNSLKPGAPFILTAMNALWMARQQGLQVENFDAYSLTARQHDTIRNPQGEAREVEFYTTCFTYRELKWLLESTGFELEAAYGAMPDNFGEIPLTWDHPEIMVIARRV
jgi:cyclopropane fatty-acyl-phospholipid synthase-like methyltransferase